MDHRTKTILGDVTGQEGQEEEPQPTGVHGELAGAVGSHPWLSGRGGVLQLECGK